MPLKNVIFDYETMNENMNDSIQLIRFAVDLFIRSNSDIVCEISKSINANDLELVKKAAHKFRGRALNACANRIAMLMEKLESAEDMSCTGRCLDELKSEIEAYKYESSKYISLNS